MRWNRAIGLSVVTLAAALWPSVSEAQVLGTFQWRLAPYCNVVTLQVEQKGSVFELTGTDTQCRSDVHAGARGTAHVNPNGTVSLGFTVSRPDGMSIANTAELSLVTLGGTWRDEYGNSGTMIFTPSGPVLAAPRRITLRGDYALSFPAGSAGDSAVTFISFGRTLPNTIVSNVIPDGGPSTANCPGNVNSPTAEPGNLCVYQGVDTNVASLSVKHGDGSNTGANRFGASLYFQAANGNGAVIFAVGTWAVTIP